MIKLLELVVVAVRWWLKLRPCGRRFRFPVRRTRRGHVTVMVLVVDAGVVLEVLKMMLVTLTFIELYGARHAMAEARRRVLKAVIH